MKIYSIAFLLFACLCASVSYACDTTLVARDGWRIISFSSEEPAGEGANNGHAIHCIDGDVTTFWHTEWQANRPDYPHEICIDLGSEHPINGFSFLTRQGTTNGRIKDFELYLSNDSLEWGDPQAFGRLEYPNPSSTEQQSVDYYFGAVNCRFVRLRGLSSAAGDVYAMCAELNFYEDTTCGADGRLNQIVVLPSISKQLSTNGPIELSVSSNSAIPMSYEIVAGPATVNGNILSLSGTSGTVELRAYNDGNENYYPVDRRTSFVVIDLNEYFPEIVSKLTDAYDLQMPAMYTYLLHATATIDEADYLSVEAIGYVVDGDTLEVENVNGDYRAWWTPSDFGNHTVIVYATGSNGNVAMDTLSINVTAQVESQSVQTFDGDIIDMGTIGSQWFYGTYELPQFVGTYDTIIANFMVSCPNVPGSCDDWDRMGWVQMKAPDGNWIELFRYITPYGRGCSHSIDVTDYASLLQGRVELRMYIETWGTGGWQLDLSFDYHAGTPQYLYSTIEEIWQGTYDFGNLANLQPVPVKTINPIENTGAAKIRLVTTGHGWGDNNSGNAAEFYHAMHHLHVNGIQTFEQDLWTICNPNPDRCSPQNGTWRYDRAGWCPGVIAKPFFYDVTEYISSPFDLAYVFQEDYVDYCHPNNPDCVSGTTCEDCNASYSPHYRVGCYLVRYSVESMAVDEYVSEPQTEISVDVFPNPTNGKFRIAVDGATVYDLTCTIVAISGETLYTYFFDNSDDAQNYLFDLSSLTAGTYFMQVYTQNGFGSCKIVVL